jgi:hypothetical protein
MSNQVFRVALTAAVLFALAPSASAGTLHVANNRVDGPSCRPKASPCRSISQAITNAAAGSKIIVGPGRYGDLNLNGTLGETGSAPEWRC